MDNGPPFESQRARPNRTWMMASAATAIQVLLVSGIALRTSPNGNEPAHLAAGVYHWQTGRFDAYRVNPPLVRLWCSVPLALSAAAPQLRPPLLDDGARCEWQLDDQLLASLAYAQFHRQLVIARLTLVPLAVAGGIYCWRWSTSAYGQAAGWAAWTMWIFSPNLLAWSATICPDMAATSFGVASCYHFRRWIGGSQRGQASAATIAAALAILAKSTWIFLPPLLLLIWLIAPPNGRRSTSFGCLACMGLCLVMILNLGYGYSTSGQRLGQFCFRSRLFVGSAKCAFGNRFTETCLADLPIPLPADFLLGMDLQRSDFERGKWSYLAGRWRWGSWPHYYVSAALLKVPLGFLTVIAIGGTVRLWQLIARRRLSGSRYRRYLDHDDLMLLVPTIGMGIAISSQTGFGHHSRYALPCLPLLFILGSVCFRASASRLRQSIAWAALTGGVINSLMAWPLSHSYFNTLAHLAFAHPPLLDSNLDWGEDNFLADRWLQDHPQARPAFYAVVTDDLVRYMPIDWQPAPTPLKPGWYIVSRQRILDPRDRFTFLQGHRPVARLGQSLRVYRLTDDDLQRIRRAIIREGEASTRFRLGRSLALPDASALKWLSSLLVELPPDAI